MAINFPVLRTKRLTVKLKELSISESIALAKIPSHLEQAATTEFLNFAIENKSECPPVAEWTIAERTMAICHYLSCVVDDSPDFAVGENGTFMDYLDGEKDIKTIDTIIDLGDLGGDFWRIRHLTGWAAETIERLDGAIDGISGRLHWLLGSMAAQLVRKDEDCPLNFDEDWLLQRMKVMAALSESDFIALSFMHQSGIEKLHHLFAIDFDDEGIIVLPTTKREVDLPPARFRARSCLSGFSQRMAGKPIESSE